MAEEVRILPTKWIGVSTQVSWGLIFGENHPNFQTHGHLDPAVHVQSTESTITVVFQEGRALELVFGTAHGEFSAIGLLSSDGKRLELAGPAGHSSYVIDGNSMVGHSHYRLHGTEQAGEEYGVAMDEYTAEV